MLRARTGVLESQRRRHKLIGGVSDVDFATVAVVHTLFQQVSGQSTVESDTFATVRQGAVPVSGTGRASESDAAATVRQAAVLVGGGASTETSAAASLSIQRVIEISGIGTTETYFTAAVRKANIFVDGGASTETDAEAQVSVLREVGVSGSSTFESDAAGAVLNAAVRVSGSSTVESDAVGTVRSAVVRVSGSSTFESDADGAVINAAVSVSGSGTFESDAAGTVRNAAVRVSGLSDSDTTSAATVSVGTSGIDEKTAALTGSQYFTMPAPTGSASFDITDYDGVAVSLWFKPTASPASACIFNLSNPGDTSAFACYQSGGPFANQILFQWRYGASGGSISSVPTDTLTVGTWYHLLLTSGNSGTKAYINGVEKDSSVQGFTKASDMFFNLGYLNNANPSFYAQGQMAFASLHKRYIWPEEAVELYNNGAAMVWDAMPSTLKEGCVAFYELANWTGHVGSEIVDQTGTRADLTAVGSVTYVSI